MARIQLFFEDFEDALTGEWAQTNNWSGGDLVASGGLGIGGGIGVTSWAHIVRSAGTYGANQYCKVTVTGFAFNGNNYGASACVHDSGDVTVNGNQNDYYCAYVMDDAPNASTHTCGLGKVVNGSLTTLGATVGITYTNGDTVEIESQDNGDSTVTLRFFKNGVEQFSRTDTTAILTGGRPSVAASQTGTVNLIDAEGGDLGVAATLDQEGVSYGLDDGNEAAHTLGTKNASVTGATVGDTRIVRSIINATGDPTSGTYSLRYSKDGGAFGLVPVGASTQTEVTLFGTAKSPSTDNSASAGPTRTITPPANMVAGDVVVVIAAYRGTTETLSVGTTGGQSWTAGTQRNTANLRVNAFRCVFNGTWDADPTFTVGSGASALLAYMLVFRNADQSTPLEVDFGDGGTSTAATYAIPSFNTVNDGAVAVMARVSQDNNSYGSFTADWTQPEAQWRTTTTTGLAITVGYRTFATAGATGDYSSTQSALGPDASQSIYFAIKRAPAVTNEVFIKPSANVPPGGVATTARMTAPAGKSAGTDFQAGLLLDDANSWTGDLAADKYTELGFVVGTQAPLADPASLKFRIYKDGAPLTTYNGEPAWSFGQPPITGTIAVTDAPDTVAATGPGAIPARLYYVIYSSTLGTPTATQIKAGQDATGSAAVASGNEVSPTVATDPYDFAQASGLTASTAYKASYVWSYGDAASDSNVVTTAEFTTAAGAGVSGTIAATEAAGDSAALAGSLVAGASAAAAEPAGDTAALSGGLTASAALAVTETTGDAAALPAALLVSASIASTEAAGDTATVVGGRVNTGTVAASDPAADTAAVAGNAVAGASAAAQESGADVASLAGSAIIMAALAATEFAVDAASIVGATVASAVVTATEVNTDTALVIATEADVALGVIAATESAGDTATAAAKLIAGAAVSTTEPASDSAAVAGAIVVSGVVTVTEAGDIALVDGKVVALAVLAATETGGDTAALVAARESFAAIAASEVAGDTAAIAGSVTTAPFTQAQLDYLLAYMEANLAIPTAEEVATAVWAKILGARSAGAHQQLQSAAAFGNETGAGTTHVTYTDGTAVVEADVPLPGQVGNRTNVSTSGV